MRLSGTKTGAVNQYRGLGNQLWDLAGNRPSLDLPFSDTKSLVDTTTGKTLVDHTRASSGTYVGSDGLIKTATTNEPRFDHDPTTGESLGLLVEEQRSNLLLNSGTLSTQSVTVTAVGHALSFTGTGTVTLSGASTAGPLVGTGTGEANRVSLTFTPTAGSLTLTVSGTVTNAQLEEGSFPTSYIPTEGSAVTRAADVASISGSNFSSWYRQDEGTVFVEVTPNGPAPTSNEAFIAIESAANNSIRLLHQTSTGRAVYQVQTPSGLQVNSPLGVDALAQNVPIKVGLAIRENDFYAVRTGGFAATDTTAVVPTGLTNLELGFTAVFPTTKTSFLISRITYWPTRLPNETLQGITQ